MQNNDRLETEVSGAKALRTPPNAKASGVRAGDISGQKEALRPFKEPVLWLIRRNGSVEVYDKVKTGAWKFKHSDGTMRTIYLPELHTNKKEAQSTIRSKNYKEHCKI